jgi:hypothetical protein
MSCFFPGLATTLQTKTRHGFEWTTEGGSKVWDFSNGPASYWVSLLFRVVWSALRSDWVAIVEVFYPDGA